MNSKVDCFFHTAIRYEIFSFVYYFFVNLQFSMNEFKPYQCNELKSHFSTN